MYDGAHKLRRVSGERAALITGLTGQDGSFLAELLLEKGYRVAGLVRDEHAASLGCSEHLRGRVELVGGDLLEPQTLRAAIERARAGEIYHLAAPSFVPASWQRPRETMRAIAGSTAALLEAVRERAAPRACSSRPPARSSATPARARRTRTRRAARRRPTRSPSSPRTSWWARCASTTACTRARAITFNHESERRPQQFVTRRITRGAAAIALGRESELTLGALDAVRDWSFAGDVMHGAWLMLQQDRPDDYVLASGVPHTVAELARVAFACVDLDAERYLRVDSSLVRAPESTPSVGDPSKARERLGWRPQLSFEQLVERMVRADLQALQDAAGALTRPHAEAHG